MTNARIRTDLETCLSGIGPLAVAVSGGVDSLTLAALSHRVLGAGALMVHAASPAVPDEATRRVREEAARAGWTLRVVEAGEFADPRYRANPVDRCFFCKTNLYARIAQVTDRPIVSGANLDDLGEYRPGLDAAREHGVRHPYVEAEFSKAAVRALARDLGLGDVADLPAAPCLSSRVETGIRIEPEILAFIHATERMVDAALGPGAGPGRAVRCRVRASGVVIELDPAALAAIGEAGGRELGARIAARAPAGLLVTRLDPDRHAALAESTRARLDYCPVSRTAYLGDPKPLQGPPQVAIVAAGTSDVGVAREAERTLRHRGVPATLIADVGVAGLWRLTRRLDEIRAHPIVIAAAGMDAALPSVLGGLVSGALIAVPTSVGYGVAAGGRTALDAVLASCAPGITVVNIDNGYGAACAALRLLDAARRLAGTA